MTIIESKLNPSGEDSKANAAAVQQTVDDLRDKLLSCGRSTLPQGSLP
jgi:hypothetical protein